MTAMAQLIGTNAWGTKRAMIRVAIALVGLVVGCTDATTDGSEDTDATGTTSAPTGGGSSDTSRGGAAVGGTSGTNSVSGSGGLAVAGSPLSAECAAYTTAVESGNLLEACQLAFNGPCHATLAEYVAAQVKAHSTTIQLVEGCGSRSVGSEAWYAIYVQTYDAEGVLSGFYRATDSVGGPCDRRWYKMGTSRVSLDRADANCSSDLVCSVDVTNADQLHCARS
jgi:hypothetical protein